MTRLRAAIGLCAFCALLGSALIAQTATAATTGTTDFTCAAVTSGAQFKDAHCKESAGGTGAGFSHKAITTETATTLTNAATGAETKTAEPLFVHWTVSGVELELKAEEVTGTGKMLNSLTGEVHKASGTETIAFKKVTFAKPAGKGCVVKGGEIATKEIASETVEGTTPGLKFSPRSGTVFAEVTVEGCSVASLNKTYPFSGSIIGTPEGATTVFTRVGTTTQGTLLVAGNKAGLVGKLTTKGPSGAGLALTKSPFTTG